MSGEPRAVRRVAVITVSYKSAELVTAMLRSIAAERVHPRAVPIEITAVVVDNASGDTPALAAAIAAEGWSPWTTLITAERNGGFAYGNNVGLAHVYRNGPAPDYFFLLNPDAAVRPGAIDELVRFLEEHPTAGTAGPSLEDADGERFPYAYRFPSVISEINYGLGLGLFTRLVEDHIVPRFMDEREAAEVDWYPGAAMMVRREVIDQLGGMDEAYFLYYEETDFCLKVKRAGWSNWYVPSSRVIHLAGQSTGFSNARGPQRMPQFWFESRRRYFTKNMGARYAIATDVALMIASSAGLLKRHLQRRKGRPHFVSDLVAHSVLRNGSLRVAPAREFKPARTSGAGSGTARD